MNMKQYVLVISSLTLLTAGCSSEQLSVVAPGARVEKLAGGFTFTEGPAADAISGKVFDYLAARRPILGVVTPGGADDWLLRQAAASKDILGEHQTAPFPAIYGATSMAIEGT